MPPICPRRVRGLKKSTGLYSAKRAALGGRTLKSGQSQWFVGYKKHTFRLWISRYERGVLLVPLVSWAAPANVSEGRDANPQFDVLRSALVVVALPCRSGHGLSEIGRAS